MNFVFIVDTSLSMSQTFDSISYLDIAKSNIRKFVIEREISNYQNILRERLNLNIDV